ncbi:penicillin-binding protein 1C, partial [bacterium]|nr:penicillin-binding protein 1C [bacterium]
EAALLAGLPQSPSRLRPDRHPRRARVRRDHVLRRMHACGTISNAELDVALREPVRVERRPFPFEAPHFSLLVRQRYPGKATLRTTLDRRIQAVAERALSEAVAALRRDDMTNGAIVVIENRSAAVRALVGSADFHADADQGQVNGAIAPRSPGSALKPFTYALAFEHGVCTPATLLGDVPVSYTGYEPENYDRRFRGPVSARDALAHSLNIPAVALLKEVGQPNVHALLKTLGLTTLTRGSGHYGLALTLGSVETTLLELTAAYATLGRLGLHRPYRLLEDEPVAPGRRVLSKGAAYLVADVLADTTRLKGHPLWKSASGQRKMAWKTGTSFGHRDAWTIAYTPDYTVGVWLGNFDGRPSRALVGIRSAAPVAARIIEQLPDSREPTWFARPDEVVTRPVCAASGQPLGPHCPRAAEGLCLAGRSPGRACSVHVLARIDTATGSTLCPACTADRPHTTRVAEVWPPNLAAWLRRHQPHRPLAPPHLAACPRNLDDRRHPRILSPSPEQTYVLLADQPQAEQKLRLEAVSAADTLYWFVDGTLLATSPHGAPTFWPLARGRHAVVCSDGAGRSSRVEFEVCGDGTEVSARASLARR